MVNFAPSKERGNVSTNKKHLFNTFTGLRFYFGK